MSDIATLRRSDTAETETAKAKARTRTRTRTRRRTFGKARPWGTNKVKMRMTRGAISKAERIGRDDDDYD